MYVMEKAIGHFVRVPYPPPEAKSFPVHSQTQTGFDIAVDFDSFPRAAMDGLHELLGNIGPYRDQAQIHVRKPRSDRFEINEIISGISAKIKPFPLCLEDVPIPKSLVLVPKSPA